MQGPDVLAKLRAAEPQFRAHKRKRIGYRFLRFRAAPERSDGARCSRGPSYFIVSHYAGAAGAPDAGACGPLCGYVVVCHASGERNIHPTADFFDKYEVAESSSTAYPRKQLVRAFFPDREFLEALGGARAFTNFWGRRDEVSLDTVVVMHAPGEFYTKPREAFRALYTADTRDRSGAAARPKSAPAAGTHVPRAAGRTAAPATPGPREPPRGSVRRSRAPRSAPALFP